MNIVVVVDGQGLIGQMAGYPGRLRARLARLYNRLTVEVQRAVKERKLSGQVLHVRTGTLRRSINREVRELPDRVEGVVGTNVVYAAKHEYGFKGQETVREHLRTLKGSASERAQLRAATINAKGEMISVKVFMRKEKQMLKTTREVTVRAHVRSVDYPERSFLRSTLREFENRIRATTASEARAAVRS